MVGLAHEALRVAIGLLFFGHGAQKLLGWFGGNGREAATEEMEALGLRPARFNAVLAGVTQMAGGVFVAVGLLTPIGALLIAANMITAIRTACAGKGPWGLNGGWEYQLVLTLALVAIVEYGPGKLSLDRAFGIEHSGTRLAVAVLAVAAVGALGAIAVGRSLTPRTETT